MKRFYSVLGLNEHASAHEIKTQYEKLCAQYHPNGYLVSDPKAQEEFDQLTPAFDGLMGDKPVATQLNILLEVLAEISAIEEFDLWYDSKEFDANNVPIFHVAFYAHGEIIKLSQQLLALLVHHKENLEASPDSILPCINKILGTMQSVFHFEHCRDNLSGLHYHRMLRKVQELYTALRPELKAINRKLLVQNAGKPLENPVFKSSIVPGLVADVAQFINTSLERHKNTPILEPVLASSAHSENTATVCGKRKTPPSLIEDNPQHKRNKFFLPAQATCVQSSVVTYRSVNR